MDNKEIWNECFDKIFEELDSELYSEENFEEGGFEYLVDLIAYIIKENGYSIIKR